LQRIGITPASTDPVVATIFATESNNYGRGVVQIATAQDLVGVKGGPGNVLAALEKEVAVAVSPLEFGAILQGIGVSTPPAVRGPAGVDAVLRSTPRLSPDQIEQFMRAIQR
jgi:hypothetical protein